MSVKLRKLKSGKISLFLDFTTKEHANTNSSICTCQKIERKIVKSWLAENIRAKRQLDLQHREHGFIPRFIFYFIS